MCVKVCAGRCAKAEVEVVAVREFGLALAWQGFCTEPDSSSDANINKD